MTIYAFFQHQGDDDVPAFDLEDFPSDREARSHARWMLNDDLRNTAIDVWDGAVGTMVVRKTRRPHTRPQPSSPPMASIASARLEVNC